MMALKKFPIYEAGKIEFLEQSGVQDKAWLEHPELGNVLFKASSIEEAPEIQTDWTEKVAYELAKLLDLPATRYELAQATVDEEYDPIRGSFSISFKLENSEPRSGEEFLGDFYADYADRYPSTYAVDRVLNALEQQRVTVPSGFNLPTDIDNGAKVFVGYIMLDNLIGNCDRHDQNFEIQVLPDGTQELAPTFDQGQAMGATISDKQRQTFTTQDYHEYLEGSFYEGNDNILTPRAFEIAANLYPEAARVWQDRLARIDPLQINEIFDRLPPDRISPTAMKFAKQIIKDGREQILGLDLEPVSESILYRPSFHEFSLAIYDLATIPNPTAADRIALAQATVKAETLRQLNGNDPNTLGSFRHESVAIAPGRFSITPPTVTIEPSNRQEIVQDISIDVDDDRSL
jgi:hypothetical protein